MYAARVAEDAVPEIAPDWPAIVVVVFGVSAFAVAQGLTYPLLSLLLQRSGASGTVIGLNAGSFALGLALATLLVHRVTALLRGDRVIIAGLVGVSCCLATFAMADAVSVWFVARFVLGFCASLIFILSEAWLNAASPDRMRGRISGLYGTGICVGFAAGPLAIPLFGTGGGLAFGIMAVYVAAVAFLIVLVSRRTRTLPEHSPAGTLLRFIKAAPVLVCMVLAFGFADIAAISAMPVYFVRTGYSEAFAAVSVTIMTLPAALAQPLVGWLLDTVSRHLVAAGCAAAAAVAYLLIPFVHSELPILLAFCVIGAASFSMYTCALTLLGQSYSGGMLVAGSAAYGLAYAIGSAAGSSTTGAMMDLVGPAAAPLSAGAVLVVFTAFFLLAPRQVRT